MRCLFFFFLLASRLTQFSYGFYGFYGFIEGGSKLFTIHYSLFTSEAPYWEDHGVGSTDHFFTLKIWMSENKFVDTMGSGTV